MRHGWTPRSGAWAAGNAAFDAVREQGDRMPRHRCGIEVVCVEYLPPDRRTRRGKQGQAHQRNHEQARIQSRVQPPLPLGLGESPGQHPGEQRRDARQQQLAQGPALAQDLADPKRWQPGIPGDRVGNARDESRDQRPRTFITTQAHADAFDRRQHPLFHHGLAQRLAVPEVVVQQRGGDIRLRRQWRAPKSRQCPGAHSRRSPHPAAAPADPGLRRAAFPPVEPAPGPCRSPAACGIPPWPYLI